MKRLGWILSIAGFVLVLCLVVVAFALVKPLGPALELDVPEKAVPVQAAVNRPELQAQKKICGNTGVMRLLVHGRASSIETGQFGADAVRLVVVDFDTPAVAILALPEGIWVNSPVLADQDIEQIALNMVYQTAWETAKGEPDAVRTRKATQALAQTIVDNFEFVPDYYVTVEEEAFTEFIDEIGGIEVNLTSAVDGTPEGYGFYNAGVNTLDGLRTLNLTRLLEPVGGPSPDIWGRLARQDAVLQGLRAAAAKPANLDDLVKAIRKAITTNLSVDQVLDLTCMVDEVGSEAQLLTVGPELVTIDAQGHMIPDVEEINKLIEQMGGGN
jgi:anionic cell wall polymer biosynthesis LytR-Cps2A-Psr (LCP) family protein